MVRADAAFAMPALYEALERRANAPLVRYRSFAYQAASWDRPRRVIAKVKHHLGELFPRVGFIVTTLTGTNRAVVRFYNQRGTAEQWIKEGKTAIHWTRLSCHRFRANEVRLLLGVIAYNLGNLLRRLGLPVAIKDWSLTSLQQRLFKTGGRLIRHARYFTLQLAESYLTGALFRQILQRIERKASQRRSASRGALARAGVKTRMKPYRKSRLRVVATAGAIFRISSRADTRRWSAFRFANPHFCRLCSSERPITT